MAIKWIEIEKTRVPVVEWDGKKNVELEQFVRDAVDYEGISVTEYGLAVFSARMVEVAYNINQLAEGRKLSHKEMREALRSMARAMVKFTELHIASVYVGKLPGLHHEQRESIQRVVGTFRLLLMRSRYMLGEYRKDHETTEEAFTRLHVEILQALDEMERAE